MKKLLLTSSVVVVCTGVIAKAQVVQAPPPTAQIQKYYTDATQKENVNYFQNLILKGCTKPLTQQPGVDQKKFMLDINSVRSTMQQRFSKSFSENPQIKTMMDKAFDAIAADPTCVQPGNDCRTRLVATASYFMGPLRPNVSGCDGYKKYDYTTKAAQQKRAEDNGYIQICETELSLRHQELNSVARSNGGLDQRGVYRDILIKEQNNILMLIQNQVFGTNPAANDKAICGPVASGVSYSYPLKIGLYSEPFAGLQTNKPVTDKKTNPVPVVEKKPEPCVEEVKVLHSEFVPMNFEEGSSTVKSNEVKPVKQKIEDFISSHSNLVITNIDVTSSASKTPFYKIESGKKVYDKEYSDAKNLALAKSRADFAQTALNSIKSQHPELGEAEYKTEGIISGPDFDKNDLAYRDISSQNSNYKNLVEKIYNENKDMLEKEAMITSSKDLLDTKRFTNLYDVKYKPYQGFKIVISGYSKEMRKCGDKATEPAKTEVPAQNSSQPVNNQN